MSSSSTADAITTTIANQPQDAFTVLRRCLIALTVGLFVCLGSANARAQAISSLGRLLPDQTTSVTVVLPLQNQAQLNDLLARLYNPSDPLYGKYLKPAQFDKEFGPPQTDVDAVAAFAKAHGLEVTSVSTERTLVHLTGRESDIESAFGVHLYGYARADGSTFHVPDASPVLPANLIGRVAGVVGLNTEARFHHDLRMRPATAPAASTVTGTGEGGALDPADVRAIYNLPLTSKSTNGKGVTLAVVEGDGWTPSDITQWETEYTTAVDNTPTLVAVDGANGEPTNTDDAAETTLDIDMELTLAPEATILVYDEEDGYTNGFLDAFSLIASQDTANVISASFGLAEQDEQTLTPTYMAAENSFFEKFAAQGQTMCASSGDAGAYDDSTNYPDAPTVNDPASNPLVLAVGGTYLVDTSAEAYVSESSWSDTADKSEGPDGTGGGGGVSVVWSIPTYQAGCFSTTVNTQSSTTMRNLPDVSLFGDFDEGGYSIYFTDPEATSTTTASAWEIANGTSASSPLWASFIANVDQQRATDGVAAVGEIQPVLYPVAENATKYAADFHDIDDGSNNLYYDAVKGYDDSTGWGSFNGAKLLANLVAPLAPTISAGQSGLSPLAVTISWTAITGATSYDLYEGTTSGGEGATPIQTGITSTGTTVSTTVTSVTAGDTYYFEVTAISSVGPSGLSNEASVEVAGPVTLPAGLNFFSSPCDYPTTAIDSVLGYSGAKLALWSQSTYAYSMLSDTDNDHIGLGVGYWARFPEAVNLLATGTLASTTSPFDISLNAGWNSIGDPFPQSVTTSNLLFSSGTLSYASAVAAGLIGPIIYGYDNSTNEYVYANSLVSGGGYWIYASSATDVEVPAP
jgi:kumamolisin